METNKKIDTSDLAERLLGYSKEQSYKIKW